MYDCIEHIHIKDKDSKKQNVKLNTGLVNFNKIFKILKKNKYKKILLLKPLEELTQFLLLKKTLSLL